MNKKKPETYKTDHPIIKEISIGDQFILNNGNIVTFVGYHKSVKIKYPFIMVDIYYNSRSTFTKELKFDLSIENHKLDIKYKYIPLKDKLDLL